MHGGIDSAEHHFHPLITSTPPIDPTDVPLTLPSAIRRASFDSRTRTSSAAPSAVTPNTLDIPKPQISNKMTPTSSGTDTASSIGGTYKPDFWTRTELQVSPTPGTRVNYAICSLVGEGKFFSPGSDLNIRANRVRASLSQGVMYLVGAWELAGTWLGFVLVNARFARMAVIEEHFFESPNSVGTSSEKQMQMSPATGVAHQPSNTQDPHDGTPDLVDLMSEKAKSEGSPTVSLRWISPLPLSCGDHDCS